MCSSTWPFLAACRKLPAMHGSETSLSGRVAIVTGGSRGIGAAIARLLVDAGAKVMLVGRDGGAAEQAARALGDGAIGMAADVADAEAAATCVARAIEEFGSLDILVNNAAVVPPFGPLAEADHGAFQRAMDVNLWAPIVWSTLAWRMSMRERGGAIVNTVSIGGFEVAAGLAVYHASKAGLIHLTRHLAVELAPKVRVNAVAPGVVRTELSRSLWEGQERKLGAEVPLGRIGRPEDIAPAAVFLCTDAARWITGETLVVDGGESLAGFDEVPSADD
jgi:NAD(P)-dependent dehydrogenase (short-subunit alcohol dehydrogenase family)